MRRLGSWLRTIQARLTFWSALITFAVCLLTCIVLYAGFAHSLEHEIDGFLAGEVHEMAALLARHAEDHEAVQQSFALELGERPPGSLILRMRDVRGNVQVSSDAYAARWSVGIPPADWQTEPGSTYFETVRPADFGHPVRVCSRPFQAGTGAYFIADALYPLDRMYASLATLRSYAVGACLAALLAAIAGGLLVAQRCLWPIRSITRRATAIGSQALHERLPLRGTGDEMDRLAATLNGMLARVEDHVRRVRQFTADASHELRTPLAVLRGSAEVALSRPRSDAELREVIEKSIDHYDRLARIADDLLLLAKADAGRLLLKNEPVALAEAIGDVVDFYAPLAEERGASLRAEIREPARVLGDRTYLRQLLGNLVDNALKYLDDGKHVAVSLSRENGMAKIEVIDDGPGIASEHVPHVFDRFYRGDPAHSAPEPRGAGLGLPICRTIAQAHEGSIHVACGARRGTTVTVYLPLSERANGGGAATPRQDPPRGPAESGSSPPPQRR